MARVVAICNAKGGVGKCLAPGTPVLLANGELTPIDRLFESNFNKGIIAEIDEEGGIFVKPSSPISVFSLDEKLRLVKSNISHFYRGRAKYLLEVVTTRGKEIKVTPRHPFLVLRDGVPAWIQAAELKTGDFVATPRGIPNSEFKTRELIKYFSEEIYVRLNNRRIIKSFWFEILRNSQRNLKEIILWRLAQSPAESTELYTLAKKPAVFKHLKNLMKIGLIERRLSVGRIYKYSLNIDEVIEYLYKHGFSVSVFQKLNLPTKMIRQMIYYNNSSHKCPPINPILELDQNLARFLAIVLAEGYLGSTRIVLYNTSSEIIESFTKYCERIGLAYTKKRDKGQWVVRVNGAGTLMKILESLFNVPIKGLQKSFRVSVPSLILKSPSNILGAYLGAYIDCEGSVAEKRSTVEISSASQENIIGLHYALLRFGVLSSIRSQKNWARNSSSPKKRTYYKLTITGAPDIERLYTQIPLKIKDKSQRLKYICSKFIKIQNTNNDLVPISSFLRELRLQLGFSQSYLGVQGSISDYENGRSYPSRKALSKLLSAIQLHPGFNSENSKFKALSQLSESDVFWDRVKSITQHDYNGYVYDLTVANYHNFIAGEGAFIVHNTTTALNLGAYLAAMGRYVLLVDLDPQANASGGVGVNLADGHPHIYHTLLDSASPDAVLKRTGIFGFDILPSGQSLAGATVELVSVEEREFRLRLALNKIRTNYDYILIDTPPSLGLLTINALTAAEFVVIPVQTEYFALEGLSQLLGTIELVKENLNQDLKIMGALLTMYDKRNQLSREVLKEVQKNFPGKIFEAVIPRQVSLAEAPSFGKTILQFDPDSKAARAYKQLAQEIIQVTS